MTWRRTAFCVSEGGSWRRHTVSHSHSAGFGSTDGIVISQLFALISPCVFPVRAQEPRDPSTKPGRESQLLEYLSNKQTARRWCGTQSGERHQEENGVYSEKAGSLKGICLLAEGHVEDGGLCFE